MRTKVSALLIALLAFCALGCGSGTDFNQISGQQGNVSITPPDPPEEDPAFLRLAHLSPNAGNVDVLVNGTQVGSNVPFEFFSNYLEVEAGPTRVQIRFAGTSTDALDTTVNLSEDSHSTLAVIGLQGVNTTNQGTSLQTVLLTDNVAPTANTLRARLFHTVPGAGPIRLATAEGEVLLGPVSFGQATAYAVINVENLDTDSLNLLNAEGEVIGIYTELRGGGTTLAEALENAAGFVGTNTTISAAGDGQNSLPLVAALDQAAPLGGVRLIADRQEIEPLTAQLRLAHMIPGDTQVDLLINGELVETAVSFESITAYREVPAGVTLDVRVEAHGDGHEHLGQTSTLLIAEGEATLTEGNFHTLTALVNPDFDPEEPGEELPGQLSLLQDDLVNSAGTLKLRLIHASPDLQDGTPVALAFYFLDREPEQEVITTAVAYAEGTVYFELNSADLDEALSIDVVTLDNGSVDRTLAIFEDVRNSGDFLDLIPRIQDLLQANNNALNVTVFAAGTGETDDDEDPEEIDLTLVIAVDEAADGSQTLISDGDIGCGCPF